MVRVEVVTGIVIVTLGIIAIGWILADGFDRDSSIPPEKDSSHIKKVYFEIHNPSDQGYWYVISADNGGRDYRWVSARSTTKYDTVCNWYGKSITTTTLHIHKHDDGYKEDYFYNEKFRVDDREYRPTYYIEF